ALAWLLGERVLHLPFSRQLATYAISASPDGVSERELSTIVEDAGHCPAYFQIVVKVALLHGLRELAENSVPSHLVVCEKDRVVPAPGFPRHFTTHLRGDLKVTELDNVGHVPMSEAPGRITEVITDFLEEVQPADPGRRSTG